jgi:hypothetical protein
LARQCSPTMWRSSRSGRDWFIFHWLRDGFLVFH